MTLASTYVATEPSQLGWSTYGLTNGTSCRPAVVHICGHACEHPNVVTIASFSLNSGSEVTPLITPGTYLITINGFVKSKGTCGSHMIITSEIRGRASESVCHPSVLEGNHLYLKHTMDADKIINISSSTTFALTDSTYDGSISVTFAFQCVHEDDEYELFVSSYSMTRIA